MNHASKPSQDDPLLQWVTFRLAGESYAINVMQVQEVLRPAEIAPVPGAPPQVLGIINLRGHVLTVIDTRQPFGLPPAQITDNSRILVIEAEGQVIGLLADSVAEVAYLHQSAIENLPGLASEDNRRFIQGLCKRGEELLILLDLPQLLAQQDWLNNGNP